MPADSSRVPRLALGELAAGRAQRAPEQPGGAAQAGMLPPLGGGALVRPSAASSATPPLLPQLSQAASVPATPPLAGAAAPFEAATPSRAPAGRQQPPPQQLAAIVVARDGYAQLAAAARREREAEAVQARVEAARQRAEFERKKEEAERKLRDQMALFRKREEEEEELRRRAPLVEEKPGNAWVGQRPSEAIAPSSVHWLATRATRVRDEARTLFDLKYSSLKDRYGQNVRTFMHLLFFMLGSGAGAGVAGEEGHGRRKQRAARGRTEISTL